MIRFNSKWFNDNFKSCETLTSAKVIFILQNIEMNDTTAFEVYSKKSSSRKNEVKIGGYTLYVSDPMSKGNSKIDKSCLTSKLLPLVTCPNCGLCWSFCYVRNYIFIHKNVFLYMLIYTYLAQNDMETYFNLIRKQIKKSKGVKYVRIHESGDFFSVAYIKAWSKIFDEFPDIQFYTYTKVAAVKSRGNLNVVKSIVEYHGEKINNFDIEEIIQQISNETGIPICPCGGSKKVKCMKDCTICANHEYVLFRQHGGKDPKWNSKEKAQLANIFTMYYANWEYEESDLDTIKSEPEKAFKLFQFDVKNTLWESEYQNENALAALKELQDLRKANLLRNAA